ncbi:hypothetical protein DRN58_01865 [Thermococci archaeon]|nr:MAG: hypothetical protein DRN58_01865 [Thermococci archaeon]
MMDNATWIYIENINKHQFDRLLKILKELEKEGVNVKISTEKNNLSKTAQKIYKNLKNPVAVAKEKGFSMESIIRFNRKYSVEEIMNAIEELKDKGLVTEENNKIKVITWDG